MATESVDGLRAPSKVHGRFEQTREQALRLFVDKGYLGVGMRELAASLGLTVGSLYNHIESKEALLLEFVEEFYDALYTEASARLKRLPVGLRPQALVEAHLALHERMPAHFVLVENDARHLSEAYRAQVDLARQRYVSLLAVHCDLEMPVACAVVALLNSAPAWLFGLARDARRRVELACHLLFGLARSC